LLHKWRLPVTVLALVFFVPLFSVQAQVCGTPGNDGPGGTISGVINTYYPGSATASAGATSISVGAPNGALTPIASGDLLLVMQMQDAVINSNNTSSYGDGVRSEERRVGKEWRCREWPEDRRRIGRTK